MCKRAFYQHYGLVFFFFFLNGIHKKHENGFALASRSIFHCGSCHPHSPRYKSCLKSYLCISLRTIRFSWGKTRKEEKTRKAVSHSRFPFCLPLNLRRQWCLAGPPDSISRFVPPCTVPSHLKFHFSHAPKQLLVVYLPLFLHVFFCIPQLSLDSYDYHISSFHGLTRFSTPGSSCFFFLVDRALLPWVVLFLSVAKWITRADLKWVRVDPTRKRQANVASASILIENVLDFLVTSSSRWLACSCSSFKLTPGCAPQTANLSFSPQGPYKTQTLELGVSMVDPFHISYCTPACRYCCDRL